MKKHHKQLLLSIIIIALLFYADPVFAGPGGTVVKGIFKTWWGKTLMGLLAIIFLPVILYVKTIEYFAVKKTKKQLAQIGLKNKDFSWLNLEKNVYDVFTRVHVAWNNEDMEQVKDHVNHWYWQNQQKVHLDKWKSENLKNVSHLESISKIKPLYLEISEEENFESSKIAFSITANIEDYLINRETKKVVHGKKGYNDEEKVWIMQYVEGKWLLDDIRDSQFSMSFAKMTNVVPDFAINGALNRS